MAVTYQVNRLKSSNKTGKATLYKAHKEGNRKTRRLELLKDKNRTDIGALIIIRGKIFKKINDAPAEQIGVTIAKQRRDLRKIKTAIKVSKNTK